MSRYPHFTLTVLVFLTAWLTWPAQMARANVAPPWAAQGASVDPGETPTHVRMVSEEVLLTIAGREQETDDPHLASNFMASHVEATFVMRNQGTEAESFDVWFPLTTSDGFGPSNEVQNFAAWVDGVPVEVSESPGRGLLDFEESVPWAIWPTTFPPGQDVILRVTYDVLPVGYRPFGDFHYILETGVGWQGTIGEATITIRLPYPVTPESVTLDPAVSYHAPSPGGFQVRDNEVVWHFTDLEPTNDDNVLLNVLEPGRWQALVVARTAVAAAPDSAEAQLRLARAARGAVSVKHGVNPFGGGERLAQAASDAYVRSLKLSPQQNEIYGEYAEWLLWISNRYLSENGTYPEALYDAVARGLEQATDDERLLEIKEIIASQEVQSIATPTLRPTLLSPTPVPTTPPLPSPTTAPTVTPVPDDPPATESPLCAGTLLWGLIPLALGGWMGWRRR
jgi:hypothetical protein